MAEEIWIEGDGKGFFSPQEGGPCKLTVMFEDKESQDKAFLLRNQRVELRLKKTATASAPVATAATPLSADDEVQITGRALMEAMHAHDRALARLRAEKHVEAVGVSKEPPLPGLVPESAAEQAEAAFGTAGEPDYCGSGMWEEGCTATDPL